jgi:hypothetical protein
LARNYKEFLNGEVKCPEFYDYSMTDLVSFWKNRWLENRKQNIAVSTDVLSFNKNDFIL